MKVDVILAFHQPTQMGFWPRVRWGLKQNAEYINHVYLVNDGKLESSFKWGIPTVGFTPIYHEHPTHGLSRSLNEGAKLCSTEFALIIEGDEILAPGSLAKTLTCAEPGKLILGRKRYVAKQFHNGDPVFIEDDHRLADGWKFKFNSSRAWALASGGHLLTHLPTHREIGGFNDKYGYGLHDFDYAARWMLQQGDNGIIWQPDKVGEIWHIGSGKGRASPPEYASRMFVQTLSVLYKHRYHLGCGDKLDPTSVNVDLAMCSGADLHLDCTNLNWIPDNTAWRIMHAHFLEHMSPFLANAHLQQVYRKLRPGGEFAIVCPDVMKIAKAYIEAETDEARTRCLQGFYSDPTKSHKPGWAHYWGYDALNLSKRLEAIGFEIDFASDDTSETCGWRDLLIQAIKPEDE